MRTVFAAIFWGVSFSALATTQHVNVAPGQSAKVKTPSGDEVHIKVEAPPAQANEPEKRPLITKNCVKTTPFGECSFYEQTYALAGVNCTEDCLQFDSFDKCVIKSTCQFDKDSGCFKKRTCVAFDSMKSCSQWQEEPQC